MQCNKTYWEWFVTTDQKSTKNSEWPSVTESNLESWRESAQKSAPNGNVDQLGWNTPDGIHLKALYTAADTEDLKYKNSLQVLSHLFAVRRRRCTQFAHGRFDNMLDFLLLKNPMRFIAKH
jgi:hypothetical protein